MYILLGTLHQKMGRVSQALQNFNIAMALDPKEAVAMRANFEAIGQPEREGDGEEGDYDYYRGDGGGGGDHHHHRNELRGGGGGGGSDDDEDSQAMLSGTGDDEEDGDEEEEDEMNDLHFADARGM